MQPTVAHWTRIVVVIIAANLASGSAHAAPGVVGKSEVRSLSTFPERHTSRGAERIQQRVVTAHHANGGISDSTTRAPFRSADSAVVRVEEGGLVVPLKNGSTEITAEAGGQRNTIAVVVEGVEREETINFANEPSAMR
jgi:hypothetical protein